MELKVNDVVYRVNFQHGEVDSNSPTVKSHHKEKRYTKCKITENDQLIGVGIAKCYHKDNFNKEIGRQESFKKALKDASFTKEYRTLFWEIYRIWGKDRF